MGRNDIDLLVGDGIVDHPRTSPLPTLGAQFPILLEQDARGVGAHQANRRRPGAGFNTGRRRSTCALGPSASSLPLDAHVHHVAFVRRMGSTGARRWNAGADRRRAAQRAGIAGELSTGMSPNSSTKSATSGLVASARGAEYWCDRTNRYAESTSRSQCFTTSVKASAIRDATLPWGLPGKTIQVAAVGKVAGIAAEAEQVDDRHPDHHAAQLADRAHYTSRRTISMPVPVHPRGPRP